MLGKGNSPSAFTSAQVVQAKCVVNEVDSASSLPIVMHLHRHSLSMLLFKSLL